MGKAKKITVGFKYLMSLQMGICRGPVDALLEIRVGDRQAWQGEFIGNTKFGIHRENLFGGTKGEGGIDGSAELYMGGAAQTVSSAVKSILPGLSSEFRGIVTLFFDGMVCAMNPYPKPWAFKLRRLRAGWDGGTWYADKIEIQHETTYTDDEGRSKVGTVRSMNGVHILYEACTNRVWGRGIPRYLMKEDEWRYAADLAFNEKMGLCIGWKRTDNLDAFAQNILDHLGGTMYVDKQSGLLTMKLIRDDYVFEELPVFTNDTGLLEVEECSISAGTSLINEVVVAFHSPLSNEDGKVRAHNLAAIQTAGSIVSSSVDYMGAPTAELAQRLADRDLNAQSIPLRGFKCKFDHRGWKIQPGSVFRIQDPKRGGIDVAIRAGAVEELPITDGYIHVSAVEDVFAMPVNGTAAVQPPLTNPPDRLPSIARRRQYEVPYAILNRLFPPGEFNAIEPQWGYYGMAAEKPTSVSLGYDLAMRAGGETNFDIRGQGGFVPLGELMENISFLTTLVKLNKTKETEDMEEGQCIYLGEEIMRVDAVDDKGSEVWLTVARGVYDTVPNPQAAGLLAWFFEEDVGSDSQAYVGGEKVDGKVLPYTFAGRVEIDDAPTDTVNMNFRFARPYPPGYVWLNNQWRWFTKVVLNKNAPVLTISWTHRDRVAQEDTRIDHEVGNIGPEPGTTYALRIYNDKGVLLRNETGVAGTQYQYLWSQAMSDLGVTEQDDGRVFDLRISLYSRRNGLDSWQGYSIAVQVEDIATYLQMAQMAQQTSLAASYGDGSDGDDSLPTDGLAMASFGQQTGTAVEDNGDGTEVPADGLAMASLGAAASQMTLMPVTMDATVFEAPYLELYRQNLSLANSRPMAVVARTSDRLTDGYEMWTSHMTVTVDAKDNKTYTPDEWKTSGSGAFTPWAVTTSALSYLDTQVNYGQTSEMDGVPLEGIAVGDLALIGKEIVRVDAIGNGVLVLGRGVADTVPAVHYVGTPIWFFQKKHAMSGYVYGAMDSVGVKLKPETHTIPYPLDQVPTTIIDMNARPNRPYPPGDLWVDNHRWWIEARAWQESGNLYEPRDIHLSWKHRDRLSQAGDAVDHMTGDIGPEPGVKYRVWVGYTASNGKGGAVKVTLRQYDVDGTGFTYTAAMARDDGAKAGPVFNACNTVGILMTVFAVNPAGLESWQGYSIFLSVPTNACPPGQAGGGGIRPPSGGGGTGGGAPGDPSGPDEPKPTDPTTPDPTDPVDPNWPPEEPPVITDPPTPPDPDFEGSWSYDWDHGWANTLPKTI